MNGAESLRARARARLRPEPPGFVDRRADMKGDHSIGLDRGAVDPVTGAFGPAGGPKLAAVLVPVVLRPEGATVLLTERAASLRQHSGQIALPGGRVDPTDASPLDTALREAEEEIGLPRTEVEPAGYLDAYLTNTNYFVLPVVGWVRPGFALALNADEVAATFEVPLAFLMDEGSHELHAREWMGGVRQYYAMPYGDHYIWGVTAGILRNMYERLFGS